MDDFTKAYLICALWSSNDESTPSGGYPLDDNYGIEDLAPETLKQAESDCKAFQEANAADLVKAGNDEQNGHDFWLTRNHHGAGFWDRGYDKEVAKRLTDDCHAYGEVDLYVGDDGKIY
jgi:hypothetical protein